MAASIDLAPYLWPDSANGRQPQTKAALNRDDPLAPGIVAAYPLSLDLGDWATDKKPLVVSGTSRIVTPRGFARQFNGSSDYVQLPTTDLVSGYPISVSCWFYKSSGGTTGVMYSLNGAGYNIIAGMDSGSGNSLGFSTAAALINNTIPAAAIPLGWNHLVQCMSAAGGPTTVYLNGQVPGAPGVQFQWGQPAAGNHSIGNRLNGSTPRYFTGALAEVVVYGRILSPRDAACLYENAYRIYAPSTQIWLGATAAGGAAALASNATSTASATGNLTTGIPIAGAALVVATGAADVTTGISLATNTQGIASSAGSLTTGIPLAGVAVSAASAGGALSTQINITAAALAQALSSAAMSSGINMPAAAVAQAAADGTLTTAIALIAAAVAQASSSATLGGGAGLAANATAQAAASAALTVQIQLSAAAISQTAASAGLFTAIPLAANATAEASASATLGGGSPLATVAVATATAGGELTTVIPLAAAALAAAIAAGGLTVAIPLAGLAAAVAGATAELTAQIHIAGQAVAMASAMADLDTAAGAWEDNPVWMTSRVEQLTVMTASVTRAIKYTAGATRAH